MTGLRQSCRVHPLETRRTKGGAKTKKLTIMNDDNPSIINGVYE